MKKIISFIIVLAMCVSLCACGTETTTQEKNKEAMAVGQSEATISTDAEVQETTESIVYAESFLPWKKQFMRCSIMILPNLG